MNHNLWYTLPFWAEHPKCNDVPRVAVWQICNRWGSIAKMPIRLQLVSCQCAAAIRRRWSGWCRCAIPYIWSHKQPKRLLPMIKYITTSKYIDVSHLRVTFYPLPAIHFAWYLGWFIHAHGSCIRDTNGHALVFSCREFFPFDFEFFLLLRIGKVTLSSWRSVTMRTGSSMGDTAGRGSGRQ